MKQKYKYSSKLHKIIKCEWTKWTFMSINIENNRCYKFINVGLLNSEYFDDFFGDYNVQENNELDTLFEDTF